MTKEQLIIVAEELNTLMDITPPIDITLKPVKLKKLVKKAVTTMLEEEDELTENTAAWLLKDKFISEEHPNIIPNPEVVAEEEEEVAETPAKKTKKKVVKKEVEETPAKKVSSNVAITSIVDGYINEGLSQEALLKKCVKLCEERGTNSMKTIGQVRGLIKYRLKNKGKDFYSVDVSNLLNS